MTCCPGRADGGRATLPPFLPACSEWQAASGRVRVEQAAGRNCLQLPNPATTPDATLPALPRLPHVLRGQRTTENGKSCKFEEYVNYAEAEDKFRRLLGSTAVGMTS